VPESYVEFLEYLVKNRVASYAQLAQDLFVLYAHQRKRGGFFVEFGASDGVSTSNTCMLERAFGWTGILAEPLPAMHEPLAENRRAVIDHRCVYARSGETVEFAEVVGSPQLSGIARHLEDGATRAATSAQRRFEVPTVSLADLLADHGAPRHIDYLSVDTEGSELAILGAFDFTRHDIDVITVEHLGRTASVAPLRALLAPHGYRQVCAAISRWDSWFVHDRLDRCRWADAPAAEPS
jgi:FkbM family methyltransferase